MAYSLDGPVPPIAVSVPHEEFSTVILVFGQTENIFQMEAEGQSVFRKYGGL